MTHNWIELAVSIVNFAGSVVALMAAIVTAKRRKRRVQARRHRDRH